MASVASDPPVPSQSTGPHNPHCDLDLSFSISKNNVNRSEEFFLIANYSINETNKYNKKNEISIPHFEYHIGSLNKNFNIKKIDNITLTTPSREIIINGSINSTSKTKNWTITSDINISTGPIRLFYPDSIIKSNLQLRSGKQMYPTTPKITYSNPNEYIKINITNNIPHIDINKTKASIINRTIAEGSTSTLIFWNPSNDLEISHIISE